ncbi:MAE_28990/MAE_18760 family HEPN-like nuclease [Pectobacterium carotovorum]|uniref:MAE_28990/MAE_18760 family HEPN-like nuclease n=1 Tax=Pectobacterium TaxID=122277 RepID=UPI0019692445|nr:MAE_28990/MAE_18760 family HEPN-like nuclease [Pectobacterium versatile]MBN3061493.1 hypothetical protein [Pectobacterium versatile]HEE0106782.1 hypothetical protein [Citrobacter gillenii]
MTEFKNRCETIENLFNHIDKMSDGDASVKTVLILKSSFFVAMYNNVEATFYAVFERIHKDINTVDYDVLSTKLKKLFIDYHFNSVSKLTPDNFAKVHSAEYRFPLLDEFLNRKKIFSGNLDVKKAKEIYGNYGLSFYEFEQADADAMLIIKNKRNSIAHGEDTLLDAGKGFTNKRLKEVMLSCQVILEKLIAIAEQYIQAKRYLRR